MDVLTVNLHTSPKMEFHPFTTRHCIDGDQVSAGSDILI